MALSVFLLTVVFAGGAAGALDPVAQGGFYNTQATSGLGRGTATGITTVYEDTVSGELVIQLRRNTSFFPAFTVAGRGTNEPEGAGDSLVIIKAFVDKRPPSFLRLDVDVPSVQVTQVDGPGVNNSDWQWTRSPVSVDFYFNTSRSATLDVSIDWDPVAVADKGYPLLVNTRILGGPFNNVDHYIPSAAVKGQVTDGGSPVVGAEVKLFNAARSYEDTTDSAGNYEIKDVFVDDYTLETGTCDKEKSVSLTVEGGWNTQDLDLVARALGTVSGTVTGDDGDGPPYPPLFLAIVSNYCTTASDLTDSNGHYSFQMPIDVEVMVKAEKSGYVAQTQPVTAPESNVDFLLPQDCPFCPNGPSQG